MPNRTAKFVSALFASFLAGAPLTTVSHSAAGAADECLSGPKDQTPQGRHWYYRIDHATKRHCWYLADERGPLAQTAAPNSSASAKPPAQDAETAMQQSVANARAELPGPTRIPPPNHNAEMAPALAAAAIVREDNGGAATPGAPTSRSLVASRWPDPYGAEPSTNPLQNKRDPGTGVTPASRTQPTSLLTAGQFAAADLSSQTPAYSLQVQLAALMGVLALAGIMGTVIFKFGSSQRSQSGEIRRRRVPIWESTDDDRIVLSHHPGSDGFARSLDQAAERSDRIAEFFTQISRRAPT
jgi:hypothetical protein